jgi:hypothetical protein
MNRDKLAGLALGLAMVLLLAGCASSAAEPTAAPTAEPTQRRRRGQDLWVARPARGSADKPRQCLVAFGRLTIA